METKTYQRKNEKNHAPDRQVEHGTLEDRQVAKRATLALMSVVNYGPAAEESLLPSRQPDQTTAQRLTPDTEWDKQQGIEANWQKLAAVLKASR